MIAFLIILVLLLLLCGKFTILLWIVAPFAAIYLGYVLYSAVRYSIDPVYRKSIRKEVRQAKIRRARNKTTRLSRRHGRCSSFDKRSERYFATGDIRYMLIEDFDGD